MKNYFRKMFLPLMAAGILLANTVPASAEVGCQVESLTKVVSDGEDRIFKTEFYLENNPGFNAVNLELIYDPQALVLNTMNAEGGLLEGATQNPEAGLLAFDSVDNLWEDGKLLEVSWKPLKENFETQVQLVVVAMGNAEGTEITDLVTSKPVTLEARGEEYLADGQTVSREAKDAAGTEGTPSEEQTDAKAEELTENQSPETVEADFDAVSEEQEAINQDTQKPTETEMNEVSEVSEKTKEKDGWKKSHGSAGWILLGFVVLETLSFGIHAIYRGKQKQ